MQQFSKTWVVALLFAASFTLVACQGHGDEHHAEHPAEVEHIDGSELSRVTLTVKAVERLDVQTGEVTMQTVAGAASPRKVVPYSSVIYDPQGDTWIYTSPSPRTFVRAKIDIDYIEGDWVVLNDGPEAGTVIATVAVSELYGTEFEVGH